MCGQRNADPWRPTATLHRVSWLPRRMPWVWTFLTTAAWLVLVLLAGIQPTARAEKVPGMTFDEQLIRHIETKYGKDAGLRLNALAKLVREKAGGSELDKVRYTNDFFNQIDYYTDPVHWGKDDYWATPVEKLATNGGDCEDYAIAKYFTLKELGVSEKKLRMMYVKALDWGEAHMVLAYFPKPSDVPLVLDNLNPDVLPATERKDLVPVYSFNGDGLWLAKARGTGKKVGGSERIGLWSDLMKRMDGSDM